MPVEFLTLVQTLSLLNSHQLSSAFDRGFSCTTLQKFQLLDITKERAQVKLS
jgi:hypothetical protein